MGGPIIMDGDVGSTLFCCIMPSLSSSSEISLIRMPSLPLVMHLPAEIWRYIFSLLLQGHKSPALHSPFPLVKTDDDCSERATVESLGMTCRFLYSFASPILGDRVHINDLDVLDHPDMLERSAVEGACGVVRPSSLRVTAEHLPLRGDIDRQTQPSFSKLNQVLLQKPIWYHDEQMTVREMVSGLAAQVGHRVDDLYILRSKEAWTFEDVVEVSRCFQGIRTLHVTDVERSVAGSRLALESSSSSEDEEEGAGNIMDGGQGQGRVNDGNRCLLEKGLADLGGGGLLRVPCLEWVGFGDVGYLHVEDAGHDHRAFKLFIKDLVREVRPSLRRVDILHYVGCLVEFFRRYNGRLEVVCFSLCALRAYEDPLCSCPSLRSFVLVVDLLPVRYRLMHSLVDSVTFFIPAGLWPASAPVMSRVLNDIMVHLLSSHLPCLRTVRLCSEIPLSASQVYNVGQILSHLPITLVCSR